MNFQDKGCLAPETERGRSGSKERGRSNGALNTMHQNAARGACVQGLAAGGLQDWGRVPPAMMGRPRGAGEGCEEHGVAERSCHGPTTAPLFSITLCCSVHGGDGGAGNEGVKCTQ